jgi:hypothetical protein
VRGTDGRVYGCEPGCELGCVTPVRTKRLEPSLLACACGFTAWRSGEKANMAAAVVWGRGRVPEQRGITTERNLVRDGGGLSHENGPSPLPGGAVRDEIAALLGTSSQTRDPATDDNNSAEGAAKEEDALT